MAASSIDYLRDLADRGYKASSAIVSAYDRVLSDENPDEPRDLVEVKIQCADSGRSTNTAKVPHQHVRRLVAYLLLDPTVEIIYVNEKPIAL